jgi:DNA-binding MarR family transcriptional regulator
MCAAKDSARTQPPPAEADRAELLRFGSGAYRAYVSAEIVAGQVIAQHLDLGATDFFCLNLIALEGSATAGEIASKIGLTTGATTRLIDRLEAAGFVERVRDDRDRRRVNVQAAPERRADTDAALLSIRQRMAEVFQAFDDDALRIIFEFFTAAAPALRAATAELSR